MNSMLSHKVLCLWLMSLFFFSSIYGQDRVLKKKTSVEPVVEGKFALVIGNAKYKNSPLQNPANDAKDMADMLKKLGFEVELLLKADITREDEVEFVARLLTS